MDRYLSATTLPSGESFQTIAGPTYGTVYRGVAYVCGDTNKSGVCTRGKEGQRGNGKN